MSTNDDNRDVLAAAKTGSGKTLAFLIPVLDLIERLGFKARNGTGAVIISPTRELAMQTYGVLRDLAKFHNVTYGLVMGGTNRAEEAKKLAKGINILVATPGKLMDHLKVGGALLGLNLIIHTIRLNDNNIEISQKLYFPPHNTRTPSTY